MSIKYTIGLDFGTDSVRALIVNTINGAEIANAVSYYSRWKKLLYCDISKSQFRQHLLDYIESLEEVLKQVLTSASENIR